jgi:hypothetical protein
LYHQDIHTYTAPNFVEKVSGRSGIFCKNAPTTREITLEKENVCEATNQEMLKFKV